MASAAHRASCTLFHSCARNAAKPWSWSGSHTLSPRRGLVSSGDMSVKSEGKLSPDDCADAFDVATQQLEVSR